MIESELISAIIDATIEGETYKEQITNQLAHLEEVEYEHTGSGLLVYIDYKPGATKHRLNETQQEELFGESDHELAKVELINEPLKIKADVSVHFSNGIIDRVEIWNQLGDYPEDDLESWELKKRFPSQVD